jgi:hypothetical protein
MRCCEGLPQQLWHHTSVLSRNPLTVLFVDLHHELGIDHLVDEAACRQQVNLRLLDLDHRAAGIRELVQLLAQRIADGEDARADVLVVVVGAQQPDELRGDRAEFDRLRGQALRGPP